MIRLDDVLGYNNLKIYQDTNSFSFSLDSIVLGNYSTIRKRDKNIVDFCCGNGVIPLILSRRCGKNIIGVEIQEEISLLAKKSVSYNNLGNRIKIVNEDIKQYASNHLNCFDLVLCNPPFFKVEANTKFSDSYNKVIARHEVMLNLEDLCIAVKKVLKDNGNFCMVHRSERLMEIIEVLRKHNLEPKRLKFVHETINSPSTLVLIESQKAGHVGLNIDKPLILYELDGCETLEYSNLQKEVNK